MATLKNIRIRKNSIQSTKKITSAMKLIAAAKLRKAQERVYAARPYADLIAYMLNNLLQNQIAYDHTPRLLLGNGSNHRHLFVIITSDRGLCGGFNSNVIRQLQSLLQSLNAQQKTYEFLFIGRKGYEALKNTLEPDQIIDIQGFPERSRYIQAKRLATRLEERFYEDKFDVCTVIYTKFISVIQQQIVVKQLIPFEENFEDKDAPLLNNNTPELRAFYEYEPDEKQVLEALLAKNLSIQIYRALLENAASENAARMTAMDAATRNAGTMIKELDLQYNRTRQAFVTRELIEIISGAEAL